MTERERVINILKNKKIFAKKSFGQNFLIDDGIIKRIITNMEPEKYDTTIEIGSGLGSLSIPLSKVCNKLFLVDADRDMITFLKEEFNNNNNINIIQSDFLKVDPDSFSDESRLFIGNLPYNITSSLIEYMLEKKFSRAGFMIQKEVYDKFLYQQSKKENSPLGAFISTCCKYELVTFVDRSAFYPSPKVDSAFVRLDRVTNYDFSIYPIFKIMFKDPNKTILNCLKQFPEYKKASLALKDIDEVKNYRARQLDSKTLLNIAEKIRETNL